MSDEAGIFFEAKIGWNNLFFQALWIDDEDVFAGGVPSDDGGESEILGIGGRWYIKDMKKFF